MSRSTIKTVMSAILATVATLALPGLSRAGDDPYLTACTKWTNEEAGMQYRCFECMRLVAGRSGERWVNICSDNNYPEQR